MNQADLAPEEASGSVGIHAATGLPTWRVWTVAALAFLYSAGFALEAVVVLYLVITGTGNASVTHENRLVLRGAVTLGLLLAVAAAYSAVGAIRLVTRGDRAMLTVPLSILLVVGTIGECVDLAGTASGSSNLVGGAILFGAALPLVLLFAPARWGGPRGEGSSAAGPGVARSLARRARMIGYAQADERTSDP